MLHASSTFSVKSNSLPVRCEICHQSDLFDRLTETCGRCAGLITPKLQSGIRPKYQRLRPNYDSFWWVPLLLTVFAFVQATSLIRQTGMDSIKIVPMGMLFWAGIVSILAAVRQTWTKKWQGMGTTSVISYFLACATLALCQMWVSVGHGGVCFPTPPFN